MYEILRRKILEKLTKHNSQGIILVASSCQTVECSKEVFQVIISRGMVGTSMDCAPFSNFKTKYSPTDKNTGIFWDVGNSYRCRLQIPPTLGSMCLLKVLTCLPSLQSE